jgi:hypothetical protein
MNNIIFDKNWRNYYPFSHTPAFLDFRIEILSITISKIKTINQ